MGIFSGHRLIGQDDGYVLVLYLDGRTEFAQGLGTLGEAQQGDLRRQIAEYMERHLPGVRIKTAQLMVGSLMVAALTLIPAAGPLNASRILSNPQDRLVVVNKVNSLAPDYVPPDLVVPDVPSVIPGDAPQKYLRKEAAQALEGLFRQAQEEGMDLRAVSGFRSYDYQARIFAENLANNPQANRTSARPGESEHQTGWAMDVSGAEVQYRLVPAFGETKEGRWLAKNAPRFGFVIRYPKDKEGITGYSYEPWHIRYVGVDRASLLSQQGLTLEEYEEGR